MEVLMWSDWRSFGQQESYDPDVLSATDSNALSAFLIMPRPIRAVPTDESIPASQYKKDDQRDGCGN
tara:strand:+ start:310 stop:510 length:201 start_codon:yes stop_codon:yes gene_type:complete